MFELGDRSVRHNLALEQLDYINMHKHTLVSALIVIYMCVCEQFSNSGCHKKKKAYFFPIVSKMIQKAALKGKKNCLSPGDQVVRENRTSLKLLPNAPLAKK